jgi:hypothetical protein
MKKSLPPSNHFLTWILVSLTILFARSVAQAQVFQDSTFNNSDWTATLLPLSVSGADITTSPPGKDTINGNPGSSRKTTHIYPTGDIFVAHVYSPSSYNPATQGAIVSLSSQYDLTNSSTVAGDVAYSLLVKQNGRYYHAGEDYIHTGSTWTTFATGPKHTNLTAASFVELAIPPSDNHPDFSCNGSRIEFGYLTRNHNPNSGTTDTTISNLDNWKVSIDPTRPCTQCGTITEPRVTCDQGVFTYTFTLTNNTNQTIEWLLLSPPAGATYTVAPSPIHLSPILQPGGHANVSVTIGNAHPGDNICINVALADKDIASCCTVQTCFDLRCPCLKVLSSSLTCPHGVYTFAITVQNLTGATLQPIFIVPQPSTATITPSVITAPLINNQTITITGTITNVPPGTGQVCLRIVPLGSDAQCCPSERVCLDLHCHQGPPGPPPPPDLPDAKKPKK